MTPREAKHRSCLDKKRQPDEATARAVAMHMIATHIVSSKRAWVYSCVHCRGWHVTTTGGGANTYAASVTATDPWVPSVFAR